MELPRLAPGGTARLRYCTIATIYVLSGSFRLLSAARYLSAALSFVLRPPRLPPPLPEPPEPPAGTAGLVRGVRGGGVSGDDDGGVRPSCDGSSLAAQCRESWCVAHAGAGQVRTSVHIIHECWC